MLMPRGTGSQRRAGGVRAPLTSDLAASASTPLPAPAPLPPPRGCWSKSLLTGGGGGGGQGRGRGPQGPHAGYKQIRLRSKKMFSFTRNQSLEKTKKKSWG